MKFTYNNNVDIICQIIRHPTTDPNAGAIYFGRRNVPLIHIFVGSVRFRKCLETLLQKPGIDVNIRHKTRTPLMACCNESLDLLH